MENEKDTQIEVMPYDKLVTVTVSGAFLNRVQSVLVYLLSNFEQARIKEAAERIRKGEHTEPWEFHYETLAVLINDIERAAKEENLTVLKTISELESEEQSTPAEDSAESTDEGQ
jgi:hypothetical protein